MNMGKSIPSVSVTYAQSGASTLGWNTFPVPTLTEKNKANLTRCAEDILLERILVGCRFKNDTERLEKLFDLYTRMTAAVAPPVKGMKHKVGASV